MNPLTKFLLELQEVSLLIWNALTGIVRKPRYFPELVRQMDIIGVGSLPIVLLTGFFTGGVLVLQTFPTLQYYGVHNEAGRSVATSLIRELGPDFYLRFFRELLLSPYYTAALMSFSDYATMWKPEQPGDHRLIHFLILPHWDGFLYQR